MKKLIYIFFLLIIVNLISHRALAAERESDDEKEYTPPTNTTREVDSDTEYDDSENDLDYPVTSPTPSVVPVNETRSTPIINANAASDAVPSTVAPEPPTPSVQTNTNQAAPIQEVAPAPVKSKAFPWAWILTRASGIASYVLLTILSLLGMLLTTGLIYRVLTPASAWSLHRAVASVLLLSVVTHIVGLLLDAFIKLRIVDVLIPFVSPYQPLLVSLGIMGFYLLLLILITSLYTMTSHARFWRTVHALGLVMFALIFFHGILIGTDAKQVWMQAIYWITGTLVLSAGTYRMIWRYRRIRDINVPISGK